jgi:predicted MPP superfamily phosphohydrolase
MAFFEFRTPHECEWNRYRLRIPNLPPALAGLKIIHLSDQHFKPFWSGVYDRLISDVNRAHPDLILFTGDFNEDKSRSEKAIPTIRRFITPLLAKLGKYAIYGNHDAGLVGKLDCTGVTFIDRQRHIINHNGATLELIGLPGLDRIYLDRRFINSIPPREPGTLRIVLSHYPNHILRVGHWSPDVYLAGHTHGGQICLPTGTPIITHDSLPKPLCKGVHRLGNTWFIVSRGMGFTTLPIRLFCPTEILELQLLPS